MGTAVSVEPPVTAPAAADTVALPPMVPPSNPPAGNESSSAGGRGRRGGNGGRGRHGSHGGHRAKKPFWKRWWCWLIAAVFVIGGIGYAVEPSIAVPNTVGQNVIDAQSDLKTAGFENVEISGRDGGKDEIWTVKSQDPDGGQAKKSVTITLTVEKDLSRVRSYAETGMKLDKAKEALSDAGYDAGDYKIESDTGKAVVKESNWVIVSVSDDSTPVVTVHNKAAEEAAKKKAAEEKAAAEKAAAEKAAAEKAAAEKKAQKEAARKAQEQKAAEEAAKAKQQQEQQAQQQQSQSTQGGGSGGSGQSSGGSSGSNGNGGGGGSGTLSAVCEDGTTSVSAPGAPNYRGMCSGHGGIKQKLGRS
ncbi:PASTA domain-containing protein [Bifidobacterium primatium]|uniref:PASTA domain-containing protein n=1 Tax=Bifidobacterium primatium TaxID=2045438 RepID=UPI0013FD6879|nr:PASTA domain-containing protein [Bifidobacterium primatium]